MQDNLDAYVLRNRIRPPFSGTWKAVNAAADATNPHFVNPNQRFAVDWLVVDAAGNSHQGEGKNLTDYYCYGREALAVADGAVAIVVDGVPEHAAGGRRDRYNVPGNQIVLDLGADEFAFYAHLIPGSAMVRAGQHVRAGQPLGKVGNSGNSSEPHLHFQIMNKPRLIEASSLPLVFSDVWLNGVHVPSAKITEGDMLGDAP